MARTVWAIGNHIGFMGFVKNEFLETSNQGCPLNLSRDRDFKNLFFESGKENLFSKSLIGKEKIDSILKISMQNRENIFSFQNLFSKN